MERGRGEGEGQQPVAMGITTVGDVDRFLAHIQQLAHSRCKRFSCEAKDRVVMF